MNDDLTSMEIDLLTSAFSYFSQKGEFPPNKWFFKTLDGISSSQVSDYKRRLRNKGFFSGSHNQITFTPKAKLLLSNPEFVQQYREVIPTHLPLIGEVSAGRATQLHDLAVYTNDFEERDYSNCETIPIPNLSKSKDVVVLRVKGNSMVKAGVLNGDFAIVERKESEPQINEIIVARYLPEIYNEDEEINVDEMDLKGPTLKRYKGSTPTSNKQVLYYLGGLTAQEYNDVEEIITRKIVPIGKVIGFYRPIK